MPSRPYASFFKFQQHLYAALWNHTFLPLVPFTYCYLRLSCGFPAALPHARMQAAHWLRPGNSTSITTRAVSLRLISGADTGGNYRYRQTACATPERVRRTYLAYSYVQHISPL